MNSHEQVVGEIEALRRRLAEAEEQLLVVRSGSVPVEQGDGRWPELPQAEDASSILTILDPDGRVRHTSPSIRRVLGYPPEALERRNPIDLVHPDDQTRVAQAFDRFRQSPGHIRSLEYRFRHNDCSWRTLQSTGINLASFPGLRGIVVISQDVTEHRLAEARLAAQHAVTRVLAESASLDEAAPRVLEVLGESLGWELGELWSVGPEAGRLRRVRSWRRPDANLEEFDADRGARAFPAGAGLPGRVWASGAPEWISDLGLDPNYCCTPQALRAGLHGALGFPILHAGAVLGVIVFFNRETRPPDANLLTLLESLGIQLGQFIMRKQAEEALRESEERFRATFEQAAVGIAHVGLDGRWLRVNERLCDIVGYSREELLERTAQGITHPEDREADLQYHRLAVAGEIGTFAREKRCVRKDGSYVWINLTVSLVRDAAGEPKYFISVSEDATERRRANEALRRSKDQLDVILRGVADGITVQAPDGQLIFANEAAARMAGFPSTDAMLAAAIGEFEERFEILDGQRRPLPYWRLPGSKALAGEPGTEMIVCYRMRATGEERWSEVKATSILAGEGRVPFAISIFRDFTERKRAEDSLAFLADASIALGSSLEVDATLDALARLSVPALADWCVVDMIDGEGSYRRVAVAAVEPAMETYSRGAPERYARPPAHPARGVLNTGRSELFPMVDDAALARVAHDQAHLRVLKEFNICSAMYVPLSARGKTLGTVAFVTAPSGRHYGPADVSLAEELARRAGMAIDNARLYAAEQRAREAAERAADRTARLQTITAALSESVTPAQVIEAVLTHGDAALGAQAGDLIVLDEDGETLEVVASAGHPNESLDSLRRFSILSPLPAADVARAGMPLWLESRQAFLDRYPLLAGEPHASAHEALAVLPLTVNAVTIGALSFDFSTARRFEPDDRAFFVALAQQSAQALERARLYEAAQAARARAEAEQARLGLLAEASNVLAASMDYEATLSEVARLVVSTLADWCAVHLSEADGTARQLALAHATPARVEWALEMQRRYPVEAGGFNVVRRVLTTGRPEVYADIPDSLLAAVAQDEAQLRVLRELNAASLMVVPLTARGRTLGTLSFLAAESGRRYGLDDLSLAEELARRAAMAVDNARLYLEAQQAVRLRDQFLSVASHELRTPMTVLQGYTEGLSRIVEKALGGNPPQFVDGGEGPATLTLDRKRLVNALQKMERASGRMTGLIEELLDVARLQNGSLRINIEWMELGALLSTVLEGIRQRQETGQYACHVGLCVEPSPVEGVWGEWDPSRLEQILVNLIDNAIKYSPPDETVSVGLWVEDAGDGGSRAHVVVRDKGIGVPPEDQEHIFRAFTRASNASARNFPGLGLGLAISHEIVQRHGGRIWVESGGAQQGSAFHVTLPGVVATDTANGSLRETD